MKFSYSQHELVFKLARRLPKLLLRLPFSLYSRQKISRLKNLGTPETLIVYITQKCNSRCHHCFYWREINKKAKELSLNEYRKIASSLRLPLNALLLTGGETFLRDDIEKICSVFDQNNKTRKINIDTNGLLPEKIEKKVRRILSLINSELNIQISLDGSREIYRQIRGVDGFSLARETIYRLINLRKNYPQLSVSILTTICRSNIADLKTLSDFTRKIFPNIHHGFQFVRSASKEVFRLPSNLISGFDPQEKGVVLSLEKMEKIASWLSKRAIYTDWSLLQRFTLVLNRYIVRIKKEKRRIIPCLAGLADGVVYANGAVSICEFTRPFANLSEYGYDFYRLWNSATAEKMRLATRFCACTHACHLFTSMKYSPEALIKVLDEK